MKILHISHSDLIGGAAKAAYRLHTAQVTSGLDSRMLVRKKTTDDWRVIGPKTIIEKLCSQFRFPLGEQIGKMQSSCNINFHSGNWLPSQWAKKINSSDINIVNLHWVAGETISIEDIGRINKPIVWTLHDMWPFCGTEHVTHYEDNARWKMGYTSKNRDPLDKGIDLDKLAWIRKKKAWKKLPMHIIAPSQWMAECAKNSDLFKEFSISVVPNVLNTNIYKPIDQNLCREILGLPKDKIIILFGAIGGGKDQNKGHDLLISALKELIKSVTYDDVLCIVFGQSEPEFTTNIPFRTKWLGHIHDDTTLSLFYNSANMMIVPSRIDNLPQTATEAQACGVPVISFSTTGLVDIVDHKKTGYLAQPFDIKDLAHGIEWIIKNKECHIELKHSAREKSLQLWSPNVVIPKYTKIYKDLL
ncbi:glycosyltransferase [Providencia alcalifaciens]